MNNNMNLNNNMNFNPNPTTPIPNPNDGKKPSNIKTGMYKNENDMSQIVLRRILYLVILVLVVVIIILIVKRQPEEVKCPCDNQTFIDKLDVSQNINKELGLEMYYKVRSVYEDFALDTSRICGNMSNTTLVDNYFMKSTSTKFTTYIELANYVRNYFYNTPANTLLSNNMFKNKDGHLYCVYSTKKKNPTYIEMEELKLEDISANKLTYKVKEKYFAERESTDCVENCNYEYKENIFILEKVNGRWLASDFTLPY